MTDADRRALERRAAAGDLDARDRLRRAEVRSERGCAVTGATIASVGSLCYRTGLDGGLTLTRPEGAMAVGRIIRFHSATHCEVLAFKDAASARAEMNRTGTKMVLDSMRRLSALRQARAGREARADREARGEMPAWSPYIGGPAFYPTEHPNRRDAQGHVREAPLGPAT